MDWRPVAAIQPYMKQKWERRTVTKMWGYDNSIWGRGGGCVRSTQWQLGVRGTIPAFAYRHRETKRNLCRDGTIHILYHHICYIFQTRKVNLNSVRFHIPFYVIWILDPFYVYIHLIESTLLPLRAQNVSLISVHFTSTSGRVLQILSFLPLLRCPMFADVQLRRRTGC